MKRITAAALIVLLTSKVPLHAQTTALPYYTGFETAAECAGWKEFTKGKTTGYNWGVGMTFGASTKVLVSPNVEFTDPGMTDTVIQWYVSPGFNFSLGGMVDSLSINVFEASGIAQPTDSIVLYLLTGSQDPSLATAKMRLANLTTMAKAFGKLRDTGGFVIPPTAGVSYLAFKYEGVYDWFEVSIDSIYLSGKKPTGVDLKCKPENFTIVPNPASKKVQISLSDPLNEPAVLTISDVTGAIRRSEILKVPTTNSLDISYLPAGSYIINIMASGRALHQKLMVIE